jgi:bifunctional non-homologous end joining protein LigD
LADFYWAVAGRMLPHIADRPLSLVRCPEGSERPCFFQKHTTTMLPPGVGTVLVPDKKTGKPEPYITLSTPEVLASLAQMGVLEIHPWGSKNEDLEHPDRITIDLDPDEALPWTALTESAAEVRRRLKELGLASFLKTTGGKGLHVVVPVEPEHDWGVVKRFAHAFVLELERQAPERYLTKMTKAARRGRIYLDYLRNERGATAVAAYSPRAGMAVSLPLDWKELGLGERPVFRAAELAAWRGRLGRDPWRAMAGTRQRIAAEVLRGYRIEVPSPGGTP